MEQVTEFHDWVQKPAHEQWGFDNPRLDMLKVVIDLRKEKVRSRSVRNRRMHPFGKYINESNGEKYYGGPILIPSRLNWQRTFYTRACGAVIGAKEGGLPLPVNMSQVVKSVAVMSSSHRTQSALWVGPRLLLSSLNLHPRISGLPTNEEVRRYCGHGLKFAVESEISSQLLSAAHSPQVYLVAFSAQDDLGIFRLVDEYPDREDWVNPYWLIERDDCAGDVGGGRMVACVGYSDRISDTDRNRVKAEATLQLRENPIHSVSFLALRFCATEIFW